MAKSLTARLGLQRWSADTDTQERAEFDSAHAKLDDLAAMDMQGTLANRPAAAAANRGLYYFVIGDATAANNDRFYRSTGAAWVEVGSAAYASLFGGSTITASGAAVKPLVVKGAASQAANLFEAHSSAGAVLVAVTKDGIIEAETAILSNDYSVNQPVLVVRGMASQVAKLAEFRNSAGTTLLSVRPGGGLDFSGESTGASTATAGSITPPAAVAGYIRIWAGGTEYKVPVYNP